MMSNLRVVSVFSGCGWLDSGFRRAGFDIIYACDNDPAAVACYRRNVDHRSFWRDTTSEDFHRDV